MAGRQSLSFQILCAYYPVALSLQDYLQQAFDNPRNIRSILTHETDTKQYRELIGSTVIAAKEPPGLLGVKPVKPLGPLREVSPSTCTICECLIRV